MLSGCTADIISEGLNFKIFYQGATIRPALMAVSALHKPDTSAGTTARQLLAPLRLSKSIPIISLEGLV